MGSSAWGPQAAVQVVPSHAPQRASTGRGGRRFTGGSGVTLYPVDTLRILAETRGFFTRAEALAEGYDDRTLVQSMRLRVILRIRHGAYTFSDLWGAAGPERRHRILARAVMHRVGDRGALSHVTAALEHELLVWGVDLSLIHVTRLDGGPGRIEAGVHFHEGVCTDDDLFERDGMLVMKAPRAALETCIGAPVEQSLVVLDSMLHQGGSPDELAGAHDVMQRWPSMQHAQLAVRMADGRAESVGESRTRWLCHKHHLPAPDLQVEVRDNAGNLIGTTDFGWWGLGVLGEFDGRIKYGRLLREGEEPGDAVFREKNREDAIRDVTDCRMVRVIWPDLYRSGETAARIRRKFRRRAA